MNSSISNSKRFPKAFIIALCLVLSTIIIGAFYLHKTNALPAPMFTGRVALDEKIRFMRHHKPYDAHLIVLGSSTALSNISSEEVFREPEVGKSYFNGAGWGMTISETLEYWRFLETITNPRVVILYINLFDFEKGREVVFNDVDIKNYIDGELPILYYFKYHKKGYGERVRSVGRRRRTSNSFDTLNYDQGGSALFEIPENEILQNDWPEQLTEKSFIDANYIALDNLLKILDKRKILTVIIQGPLREQYFDNDPKFDFLKSHWERVGMIAKDNGMIFLNMHGMFYPDESYFPDTIHLNREGARIFTKKMFERLKGEKVFERIKKDKINYGNI